MQVGGRKEKRTREKVKESLGWISGGRQWRPIADRQAASWLLQVDERVWHKRGITIWVGNDRFRPSPPAIGRYQPGCNRTVAREEEATREKEEERERGRTSMRPDPAVPSLDDPYPVGNDEATTRLLLHRVLRRSPRRHLQPSTFSSNAADEEKPR
ncbi:hypothetical protein BHE74_00005050 [Ensete ventricosum]|nr:hypothetical protein BHE74_00005050 [Ensete ventricosum]